jgi:hypothetical protein
VRPHPAIASLVVVAALLGACTDGDGGVNAGATSTTAASDPTTTAASATSPTASTSPEPDPKIELRGDGLGVVDLGASPDEAIAAVSAELGRPTVDTGWDPPSGTYGTCPGDRVRGVEWGHLVLLFTDGSTPYGSSEHLFAWRLTGAPPAVGTAKGLGYDATVADAQELYPGEVEVTEADDPFPAFLTVPVGDGTITAYLDGEVITNLEAGAPCGE